jgi:hypothetical protein
LTLEETIFNARRFISICRREGALMAGVGHAIEESPINDETMSAPVERACDGCGRRVWGTELKDLIKELAPEFRLLCKDCLMSFVEEYNARIINTDDPNIKP